MYSNASAGLLVKVGAPRGSMTEALGDSLFQRLRTFQGLAADVCA